MGNHDKYNQNQVKNIYPQYLDKIPLQKNSPTKSCFPILPNSKMIKISLKSQNWIIYTLGPDNPIWSRPWPSQLWIKNAPSHFLLRDRDTIYTIAMLNCSSFSAIMDLPSRFQCIKTPSTHLLFVVLKPSSAIMMHCYAPQLQLNLKCLKIIPKLTWTPKTPTKPSRQIHIPSMNLFKSSKHK